MTIRRLGLPFLATAAIIAAVVIWAVSSGSGSRVATASAASYSVFDQPAGASDAPTQDPAIQSLVKDKSDLDLSNARLVLKDDQSTVWLAKEQDGDICLVESVNLAAGVSGASARFTCHRADDTQGQLLIGGVPGDWYGVAPDSVTEITATVDGQQRPIAADHNGFRVPPQASAVRAAGVKPVSLPSVPPGVVTQTGARP